MSQASWPDYDLAMERRAEIEAIVFCFVREKRIGRDFEREAERLSARAKAKKEKG